MTKKLKKLTWQFLQPAHDHLICALFHLSHSPVIDPQIKILKSWLSAIYGS